MSESIAIIGSSDRSGITDFAVPVLEAVGELEFRQEITRSGTMADLGLTPDSARDFVSGVDAIFLDVDSPEDIPASPDQAPLRVLEKAIGAHVVVQPVTAFRALEEKSPLRNERINGTDIAVVHALGDFYDSDSDRDENGVAYDRGESSPEEVKDVMRIAFDLARERAAQRGTDSGAPQVPRVTSVDKANVLEASRMWREQIEKLQATEYPDVDVDHRLADYAAMEMVAHPSDYDVVVSNYLFGHILAAEVSSITDARLIPSASLNKEGQGIFRAARQEGSNSAPAAALSVAQALRHSLGKPDAAVRVEKAVAETINDGLTPFTQNDLDSRSANVLFTFEVTRSLSAA